MNFCITDGKSVVCTRYVSSKTDEAASLVRACKTRIALTRQYFSTGTSFYEYAERAYRMVKADRRQKIVVVASEPLTFEKGKFFFTIS